MSAFPNGAGEEPEEVVDERAQGATRPGGGDEATGPAPAPGAGAAAGRQVGEPEQGPGTDALGAPESELGRALAERDEYLEALRRLQAEFDNYRKRTTRQQTELLDRATEGLLERLLPVLDAIDLALQHRAGAEGADDGAAFGQIASLLKDALARDGLERIDAVGVHFDPAIHDAVAHLPAAEPPAAPGEAAAGEGAADEGAAGEGLDGAASNGAGEPGAPPAGPSSAVVAEVLRAGYRLKGRVLRPAMVTVQG